jgi:hypothetical protein
VTQVCIAKEKIVHLDKAITKQASNGLKHVALLQEQKADLSAINDNLLALKDTSLFKFRETIASLVQTVEQIPKMSAQQSEDTLILLQAIENQVSGISAHIGGPNRFLLRGSQSFHASRSNNNANGCTESSELLESITRLSQLAKQEQATKCDTEAQTIEDDLDALLELASAQLGNRTSEAHVSRKRPIDMARDESNANGRDLKRIRGLLTSSDSIIVNQRCMWISASRLPHHAV